MAAKQLMLPANRAFDSNGFALPGATASLYTTATLVPQPFYSDAALSISAGTTITANAAGRFSLAVYQNDAIPFRLIVKDRLGTQLDDIDPFYFGATYGSILGTTAATFATRTALAAVTGAAGAMVNLSESGREGTFVWSTANLATKITADTAQGIYVAPASDPTGASGAWVRKFTTAIDPKWFGLSSTNSAAANAAAWVAMAGCLASRAIASFTTRSLEAIRFTDEGPYNFGANTIDLLEGTFDIEGATMPSDGKGTLLQFSGASGIRVQRYNTSGASGTRTAAYGADGSGIRKLRIAGGYVATEAEFHGLHLRAFAEVEDCWFYGFEGDGGFVDGSGTSLADLGRFKNCHAVSNRRGFYTDGGDANVCSFDGCDSRANRTWGFFDSSFLGNIYVACHAAANGWDGAIGSNPTACTYSGNRYYVKIGQAAWCKANAPSGTTADNTGWGYISAGGVYNGIVAWVVNTTDFREGGSFKTDDANARSVFVGCYAEGDQNPPQIFPPAQIFGGVLSQSNVGYALNIGTDSLGFLKVGAPIGASDTGISINNTSTRSSLIFNRLTIAGTVINMDGQIYTQSGNIHYDSSYHSWHISGVSKITYDGTTFSLTGAMAATGAVTGSNLSGTHSGASSGTNTGDQTITLTGDVTGTGTGSFATTLAAATVVAKVAGQALAPASVAATGAITSSGGAVGYAAGAGGTATQATSKSTTVAGTNKYQVDITLNAASLAADTTVSFTFTNTVIAATDNLIISHISVGTFGAYNLNGRAAAGSALIDIHNCTPGALAEAIVIRVTVIRGANS